ncbi:MAG: YqgE/AlgH family protein [Planctomycetota bacterium]|jgi:putative transcriptional regulator
MNVAPGTLLISRSAMIDPNFDGTVVLICTHDEEGTVGLTLNRPLEVPIEQVLPEAEFLHDAEVPLMWGGPVGNDCLHVLSGPDGDPESVLPILPGVYFGGSLELVRRIFQGDGDLRFFLGYSGWSAGQLDEELAADAWHVVPGVVEEVWTTDWRLMWERLMAKLDPQLSWMKEIPEDPEVN